MKSNQTPYIDLHIHSNSSDGAFAAEDIVNMATERGLQAIAIADHDSVSSISRATKAAAATGIELISAIELSVEFRSWRDVHLLGYGIDQTDSAFINKLDSLRERRENRNREILDKVNKYLSDEGRETILESEVLHFAKDVIGRPHIARALLERGYVKTVEEAFKHYLTPCNVPKQYWPISDAITEIKRLGGVAVLAHPTSITNNLPELNSIINELIALGLDGLEVYNNMAQPDEAEYLRRRANEKQLIITGGSDFHGIEQGLEIGRGHNGIRFSDTLLPPLHKLITLRQKKRAQFISR